MIFILIPFLSICVSAAAIAFAGGQFFAITTINSIIFGLVVFASLSSLEMIRQFIKREKSLQEKFKGFRIHAIGLQSALEELQIKYTQGFQEGSVENMPNQKMIEEAQEAIKDDLSVLTMLFQQLAEAVSDLDIRVEDISLNAQSERKDQSQSTFEGDKIIVTAAPMPYEQYDLSYLTASNVSHQQEAQKNEAEEEKPPLKKEKSKLEERGESNFDQEQPENIYDTLTLNHVKDLIQKDSLMIALQPIVNLPHRKNKHFQVISSLDVSDDTNLTSAQIMPMIEASNASAEFDRLTIKRALNAIMRLSKNKKETCFFIELSLPSLMDSDFLEALHALIEDAGTLVSHIVFEISQTSLNAFSILEEEALQDLRERGCRFALGGITDLKLDFAKLAKTGIRFVKMDKNILQDAEKQKDLTIHSEDLSAYLARLNIDLIITNIEVEADVLEILDYAPQLAQGNLFSKPKQIKTRSFVREDIEKIENKKTLASSEVTSSASHQHKKAQTPYFQSDTLKEKHKVRLNG